jgi:hypothetical protein
MTASTHRHQRDAERTENTYGLRVRMTDFQNTIYLL